MLNSFSIEGSAMLMEEPIKGVMKEVKVAMIKAAFFVPASFMRESLRNDFIMDKWRAIPVCYIRFRRIFEA